MGKYLPDTLFSLLLGISIALLMAGSHDHFQRVGALVVGYSILYFHYSPYAQSSDAWQKFGVIPRTWEPFILLWGTLQWSYGDLLVKKICEMGVLECSN